MCRGRRADFKGSSGGWEAMSLCAHGELQETIPPAAGFYFRDMMVEFTAAERKPKTRRRHRARADWKRTSLDFSMNFVWQPFSPPRSLCSASLHFISLPPFPELPGM